jgi:hypothetical protein
LPVSKSPSWLKAADLRWNSFICCGALVRMKKASLSVR